MSTVSLTTSLLTEDCSRFFAAATQNARSEALVAGADTENNAGWGGSHARVAIGLKY